MLKLESKPESIRELERFLSQIFDKHEFSSELYPNVLISLTEAVNNAIHHGNGFDRKKYVHVHLYKHKDSICFQVCDEGDGFNMDEIPDPTEHEKIEECGGRGVLLMRELCDRLEFKDNGRTVEIRFYL